MQVSSPDHFPRWGWALLCFCMIMKVRNKKMPGGLPMIKQEMTASGARPHSQGNLQCRFWSLCSSNSNSLLQWLSRFSCSGVSRCGSGSPLTLESLLILWDPSVSLQNSINVLEPARIDVHGITTRNRSIFYSLVYYSKENSWLSASVSRTKII